MKQVHENITEQTNNTKGLHRGGIELLRSRLNLLAGTDKLLMTMYIEHGNSIRQIARIRAPPKRALPGGYALSRNGSQTARTSTA